MEETTLATDRDLWMTLSSGVRAVVRKHRVPQSDGDDVAQDVLVRVFMRKESVHVADIAHYAMRAARNNCLTYWRNSRRRASRVRTGIALDELGQDAKFVASGKRQAASGKRQAASGKRQAASAKWRR